MNIKNIKITNILLKKYSDYITISFVNIFIMFIFLLTTDDIYIIPYRDMFLGFYPASLYFKALLSFITPEDFGIISNYNIGYFLSTILQLFSIRISFTFSLLLPLFIASVTINKLLKNFDISKHIRVIFSLFYAYNWITLSLWGTTLWLYAYSSIPLIILYTYRIISHTGPIISLNFFIEGLKLTFAYTLAGMYWNLPALGLVSYFTFAIFVVYVYFYNNNSSITKLVNSFTKLFVISILILALNLFFIYPKIIGIISYGFKEYVEKSGYVSYNVDWYKILMPNMFKHIFNFGFISIFTIPLFPIDFSGIFLFKIYSIFKLLYAILIFSIIFINFKKIVRNYKMAESFVGIVLLKIVIFGIIILIITNKKYIINILYSIPLISLLINVTNYFLLITPILVVIYAIGSDYIFKFIIKKNKNLKTAFIVILIIILIIPNMSTLFGYMLSINLKNENNVKFGYQTFQLQYVSLNALDDIKMINYNRSNVYYRIFWLPYTSSTVDLIKTSIGDSHKKGIFKDSILSSYYTTAIFNIVSDYPDYNTTTEALSILGYKYIGILKFISDKNEKNIIYFHGTPTKIVGSPNEFIHDNYISELNVEYNSKNVAILEINDNNYTNTPFINIYRKNTSTIFDLVNKISNKHENNKIIYNMSFIFNDKKYNIISVDDLYIPYDQTINNFTFDFFLVYKDPTQMYGHLIGWNSPRILIRKDGRILIQFVLENGTTISYFSRFILRQNDVYHIIASYNGTHVKLFINGALDSIKKIDNIPRSIIIKGKFSAFEINGVYPVNASLFYPTIYINSDSNIDKMIYRFREKFFPRRATGHVYFINYDKFDEYLVYVVNNEVTSSILALSMRYDKKWVATATNIHTNTTLSLKPVKVTGWMQGFLVPPGDWIVHIKYNPPFYEPILLLPMLIIIIIIIIILSNKVTKILIKIKI